MSELSEILGEQQQPGGDGGPAPGGQEHQPEPRQQPRDDGGRYASHQHDSGRQPAEPRGDPAAPPAAPPPSSREQDLERQNTWFREQIAGLLANRGHQQRQEPPKPKDPPPEFWVDPHARTMHEIRGALDPMTERMDRYEAQIRDQRIAYSEQLAVMRHGEDKVKGAVTALVDHLRSNPHEYAGVVRHLVSSHDPMADVIAWHGRQQALTTVGADPAKWRDSEIERMMKDPAERAKLIERLQAAEQGGGEPAPAAPAAQQQQQRPQERVVLPPSLSKLPTGRQQSDAGDMSDASLFRHAVH